MSDSRKAGRIHAAIAIAALALAMAARAEELPRFALPVACDLGRTCFIQNYVDADPSPAAKDYQCGSLTYDGHNGTDIRLPTLSAQRAGVDVLAAADGRIARRRDGVADVSVREIGRGGVRGFECGNGLVIDHGDGWETQYCHLARDSLVGKPGDMVKAGQPIGRIGLSGLSEYPHLHFTVRRRGAVVDPFAYEAQPGSCGGGTSLWQPALAPLLAYRPRTVLNQGFTAAPVSMDMVEADEAARNPPGADAAAIVAYARGIGLKAGDVQALTLVDPTGRNLAQSQAKPLERDQAQSLIFVGRKRPPAGWPRGAYSASYSVTQQGKVVLEKSFGFDLR